MAHYSYLLSCRNSWPQFNLEISDSNLLRQSRVHALLPTGAVFLDILQMAHFSRIVWTFCFIYLKLCVRWFYWEQCSVRNTLLTLTHLSSLHQTGFRFEGLAHRRMKNQLFKSYSSMYLRVVFAHKIWANTWLSWLYCMFGHIYRYDYHKIRSHLSM